MNKCCETITLLRQVMAYPQNEVGLKKQLVQNPGW
jgi:serine protease inhibitor ecotin